MKSKAITESTSLLQQELREMKYKRSELDSEIYKLESAIEKLTGVIGLQRVKRVFHTKVCEFCKKEFKAKRIDTQTCSRKCSSDLAKLVKKGVTLIKGDVLKTVS